MAIGISSYFSAYSGMAERATYTNSSVSPQYAAWRDKIESSKSAKKTSTDTSFIKDRDQIKAEAESALESFQKQHSTSGTLSKDSTNFLNTYSANMKKMDSSAKAVQGKNLDKLVGDITDGKISDENMKKTTDAVQAMVNDYNKTLTTLNDNASRGPGVVRQIERMARAPMSEQSMELAGISVNKDGTLSLNKDQFAEALNKAAAGDAKTGSTDRMDLIKDVIGGTHGIASGVRADAQAGQDAAAVTLVGNDMAKQREEISNNYINFSSMYARNGAYNMMNMNTIGLLMNVMA